jgi:hypothetical protein
MSGYLQYSTYGEDEPPQQPKRTLRTNQRTLRSKQARLINPRQLQQQTQSQQQLAQQQPPLQQQLSPQHLSPQHLSPQHLSQQHPQEPQHKYVQSLIQKIHNSSGNGSDSESESDNDDTNGHMQQQFQTQPVPNRNRFAAANSADLNGQLNPAPAKEGFSLQDANALANQYKQYMPSVFQASSTDAVVNKDVLMQKLDQIISLLEDQRDEKTGHVTEELVLYCFLGVFIIFIVDSFARAGKYVR